MQVHHIALRSHNLASLERFYGDLLGLECVRRTERSLWFRMGGAVLMLEQAEPHEPRPQHDTMEMFALAVSPTRRSQLQAHLQNAGFSPESRTEYTIYYRDPENRRVGLSTLSLEDLFTRTATE
jgi:catechol-2,3-dioxygenase